MHLGVNNKPSKKTFSIFGTGRAVGKLSKIKEVQSKIAEFAYSIIDGPIRRRNKYELKKEFQLKATRKLQAQNSMEAKLGIRIAGVRNVQKQKDGLRPESTWKFI